MAYKNRARLRYDECGLNWGRFAGMGFGFVYEELNNAR